MCHVETPVSGIQTKTKIKQKDWDRGEYLRNVYRPVNYLLKTYLLRKLFNVFYLPFSFLREIKPFTITLLLLSVNTV